jgi:hypothetical protein
MLWNELLGWDCSLIVFHLRLALTSRRTGGLGSVQNAFLESRDGGRNGSLRLTKSLSKQAQNGSKKIAETDFAVPSNPSLIVNVMSCNSIWLSSRSPHSISFKSTFSEALMMLLGMTKRPVRTRRQGQVGVLLALYSPSDSCTETRKGTAVPHRFAWAHNGRNRVRGRVRVRLKNENDTSRFEVSKFEGESRIV